jgi:predicted metal-dependent hydrolase
MSFREEFERGIEEFNNGEYFACHDTFEAIWMELGGDRRRCMQGLIQAAVGIFHASRANLTGSYSQLTKGLDKLSDFRPRFLGVDIETLHRQLEEFRARVQRAFISGAEFVEFDSVPTISYRFDPETMSDF